MKATVAETSNYEGLISEVIPFTIAKAPITVIADDKSSMQGETTQELTYTLSGKVKDGDHLGYYAIILNAVIGWAIIIK